ncbi:MAG: UDP-N-acetylmuramoyl-tripeptide--D-alanyl-D-alanine ligase [Ethanoligenens sp.]
MEQITLDFILNATGGRLTRACFNCKCDDISTDTRTIKPGSLFVALRGERFDGNEYLETAFSRGASVALAERPYPGWPVVLVEDAYKALRALAAAYRRQFSLPVVGVTGSVGKTSTKEMIFAVLSRAFRTHRNAGNLNNLIGMPMSVFGLENTHKAAVFEMGMSAFGEIAALSRVAAPEIGVITNIGISHIEMLGSQENILKAKLEILEGLRPGGKLVLNGDDAFLSAVRTDQAEIVTYGIENTGCTYVAEAIESSAEETTFRLRYPGGCLAARLPVVGRHNVYNALAAFAVGRALGLAPEVIAEGFLQYAPTGYRQKIEKLGGITFVEDCYNASPDSMRSAFDVLNTVQPKGRKLAVLADMLELGETAPEAHRAVGRAAAENGVDILLSFGEDAQYYQEGYREAGGAQSFYFTDKAALTDTLCGQLMEGDAVLFKGSRGMRLEEIIQNAGERWTSR